jgi:hypothetical protein
MESIKSFLYPNKSDILDPFSCIIKLFIYSFKPLGTKLSIVGNKLEIQNINIFQSTIRTIQRDTKTDLINLLFPITFACEKYLSTESVKQSPILKQIFYQVLKSLDNLNRVYQVNEISHNIEQLRNIVLSFINASDFNVQLVIHNWTDACSTLKKGFYIQTSAIWTEQRYNIVFGIINELFSETSPEKIDKLVSSLNTFMGFIDLGVVSLIQGLHLLR